MKLSCQLERADYLAFHRYRLVGMYLPGGSRVWPLRGFALFACAVALVEWHNDHYPEAAGLVITGITMWLFPRIYWSLVARRFRRILDDPESARLMGGRTMTLTPSGLHVTEVGAASDVAWANIIRAARTDDHIFLFTSTVQAIVIPRASVGSAPFEAAWTQAITYLDDCHERGIAPDSDGLHPLALPGTPTLSFSYRLGAVDWTALSLYHRRAQARRWHRWLAGIVVLPIPLLLVILGLIRPPVDWEPVVISTGVAVVCSLIYPSLFDNMVFRQAERLANDAANGHCLGPMSIGLSPEWLHVQGRGVASTIAWPNFVKAERTDEHIFIYLAAIEALVVPRGSLEGASFEDVWSTIDDYVNRGRNDRCDPGSGVG